MSQVKWPTPNPSGSTAVNLIHGPTANLLWLAINNLPFYIAIEALLSFLRDAFCDAGLGSTASKSDLIDGDHEEGTLSGSSKGKEPICSSKGKAPVRDIREAPYSRALPRGRSPSATTWSTSRVCALPTGTSPSVTSEETHDLFCCASSQGETHDLFCRVPFVV